MAKGNRKRIARRDRRRKVYDAMKSTSTKLKYHRPGALK